MDRINVKYAHNISDDGEKYTGRYIRRWTEENLESNTENGEIARCLHDQFYSPVSMGYPPSEYKYYTVESVSNDVYWRVKKSEQVSEAR